MITDEQYHEARRQHDAAEQVIRQYHAQRNEAARKRMESGEPFTDDELVYARTKRCPCGHGLAYFKGCPPGDGYWDCAAILKGLADKTAQHTAQLPFAFYEIKRETEGRLETTRGTVVPA